MIRDQDTVNATAIEAAGITFFPTQKNSLNQMSRKILQDRNFASYIKKLFQCDIVNLSENRAACHTAFRAINPNDFVKNSLLKIKLLSNQIREKKFLFDVKDIVNIGIGGSDLGPKLICEVGENLQSGPKPHFVSNLDTSQIHGVLKNLSPENTLFIITSKSFNTLETLENFKVAQQWFFDHKVNAENHFIAVTNNIHTVKQLNIFKDNVFMLPDWIGGRFSIWSAVGLIIAISFGFSHFHQLHQGAYEMDQHFYHTDFERNMPVVYAAELYRALIQNDIKTLAVLPYAHQLQTLPAYLQQLIMESLGKNVNTQGEKITSSTGPIVFGSTGTSSQHSFQQMMMQGTHRFMADFILPLTETKMIINCLTQVKTLRHGAPHSELLKNISGNQLVNLFVLKSLDLKTLGALLAFYEHAVVTTAFLMDINPFDQFGVEYAKTASDQLRVKFPNTIPTLENIKTILTIDHCDPI